MIGHSPATGIHSAAVLVIVFCYLLFAGQMMAQIRWSESNRRGTLAVSALVTVFVFCATAGYVSDYLPRRLEWFRDVLHVILAAASIVLVWTNQAGVIATMLRRAGGKSTDRETDTQQ